jgi:hypothetical protein
LATPSGYAKNPTTQNYVIVEATIIRRTELGGEALETSGPAPLCATTVLPGQVV